MSAGRFRSYKPEWLRADIVAGLTAAAVVVPKAMAYATIAGLPVQVGLYTVVVPTVIYALLGSSRVLSVTTTTTLAILVGAELVEVGGPGATSSVLGINAMLALLVGAVLLAACLFRLGFVASFISDPVLIGFKAGIGLVIVVDQVPKLLGVHIEKAGFLHNIVAIGRALPATSMAALLVGAGTILLLVLVERLVPQVPAPLLAVALGIVAVIAFGLRDRIALIGTVPAGLPSFVVPDWSFIGALWTGAIGVALMSFTETIAAARAFAAPDDPPVDPNRELLATGFANVGGAFFGAMAAGGGTSQTAVNRRVGAKSQLAEVATAATALLIMLFLARYMALMPQATLAAIVVVYSIGLISLAGFRDVRKVRRLEFYWAVAALAGVVLLGTLRGILVAILISLVALAQQMASPPVYELRRKPGTNVFRAVDPSHPEDEAFPDLLVLRVEGRVFFGNAARVGDRILHLVTESRATTVALDLSAVFDLEYTALKAFIAAEERLRDRGISIWLVGLTPPVLDVVQRSSLGATLGRERMHFNLEMALDEYARRQGREAPDLLNTAP